MTTKVSHQTFSIIVFLILLLDISHARLLDDEDPFDIGQLVGHRKGDTVEGLNEVKTYLNNIGYLPESSNNTNNYFDDVLDVGLRTYQSRHSLNSTGVLDIETLTLMSQPQCMVPDPDVLGNTTGSNHTGFGKWAFFRGKPRWPDNHMHLTYGFVDKVPILLQKALDGSFETWAQLGFFKFTLIPDVARADIKIQYRRMDGVGHWLGEASPPKSGHAKFDDSERWYVGPSVPKNMISFSTVALHEIGHLLGLAHTPDKKAVMYRVTNWGESKDLTVDDVEGLLHLYPFKRFPPPNNQ